MNEDIPALDMTQIYWNEEAQEYRLAIVANCKTLVFRFRSREKVYAISANAMTALARDHTTRS